MLSIACVLRSGGIYTAEWVRKLRDAVKRNLTQEHRFFCLSDVDVPCERVPLEHNWPGWWAKIELFRAGVITGPTLYFDLDTVITGEIRQECKGDFSMLQNFWTADMVGSGVMWFSGRNVPGKVYEKFAKQPDAYIAHYARFRDGSYVGDQAFVWDTLHRDVRKINPDLPGIKSYKMHCKNDLPEDARIVCFHGQPRPSEVSDFWVREHWA